MKNKFLVFLKKIKYDLIIVLTICFFAILDLILKEITTNKYFSLIDGIISIFYTENTGAAWSIFSDKTLGLIIISSIFIIFILIFNFFFKKKNVLYSISLGMILSGAICNLLDRITFGYVRDFIKLDFINFPIFNIADSAICVGVFLFCIFFIFYVQKKESKWKKHT